MKYNTEWLDGIEKLRTGDLCEVKFPARSYWMKARIVDNGGSFYWQAELTEEVFDEETSKTYPIGYQVKGIYAEHVRVIGNT